MLPNENEIERITESFKFHFYSLFLFGIVEMSTKDQFMTLTGLTNEVEASHWLEMANSNLEMAVELFFNHGANSFPSHSSTKQQIRPPPSINNVDDDYVRKPDSVKRQRLVDIIEIGV